MLAHGWWFSPGTPASSTTKTGRHDITEILLKVALKHQKESLYIYIIYQSLTPYPKVSIFARYASYIYTYSLIEIKVKVQNIHKKWFYIHHHTRIDLFMISNIATFRYIMIHDWQINALVMEQWIYMHDTWTFQFVLVFYATFNNISVI